jgi:hypothetical protein
VGGAPQQIGRTWPATVVLWGVLLICPREIQGQVGLASGEARIALVAIAPAHASLESVSELREADSPGPLRESSVMVRLSSNGGYRLIVRRTGSMATEATGVGRVWVRGLDGEFHELTSESPVTVAEERPAGEYEQEVFYRIEGPATRPAALQALPFYYDIAVKPAL